MDEFYNFKCKPQTKLSFPEDEALRVAKAHFGIFQLPNDLYHLIYQNNGGTPVKQLFITEGDSVFTMMTFLYLFLKKGRQWEDRIEDNINLLSILDQHQFPQYKLFPFAKTFAGDIVTYCFEKENLGKIFLVKQSEVEAKLDFKNPTRVFQSLDTFILAKQ